MKTLFESFKNVRITAFIWWLFGSFAVIILFPGCFGTVYVPEQRTYVPEQRTTVVTQEVVPPPWAPPYDNVEQVHYYYLPDIEMYYDVWNHQYVYLSNGNWIYTTSYPSYYSSYDINTAYVVVLDAGVREPWRRHETYVSHYPRYYYRSAYENDRNYQNNHGGDRDHSGGVRGFNENARAPIYRNSQPTNLGSSRRYTNPGQNNTYSPSNNSRNNNSSVNQNSRPSDNSNRRNDNSQNTNYRRYENQQNNNARTDGSNNQVRTESNNNNTSSPNGNSRNSNPSVNQNTQPSDNGNHRNDNSPNTNYRRTETQQNNSVRTESSNNQVRRESSNNASNNNNNAPVRNVENSQRSQPATNSNVGQPVRVSRDVQPVREKSNSDSKSDSRSNSSTTKKDASDNTQDQSSRRRR